jgi:hypothetical protein
MMRESFAARYCTWRVAKTAGREALHRFVAWQQRSLAWLSWNTAAGRAADNRRGWVANNGRHPVECNSLRGDREAGLRRMQRCSPALFAESERD